MFQHVGFAGGVARIGTRSTGTTCHQCLQPFAALVDMVLMFFVVSHIKLDVQEEILISFFQVKLIIECLDTVQTGFFSAKSGKKNNNHLQFTTFPFDTS